MSQLTLLDPVNPLGLPERVRVLSLWHRWAAHVAAGSKSIETRRWAWPYEPGWLAIHAALRADGDVEGRLEPFPEAPPVEPGTLCALVWVARCRMLMPEDLPRALCYAPDRWAWELERVQRLRSGRMRGPQKFGSVPRAMVIEALTPGEKAHHG